MDEQDTIRIEMVVDNLAAIGEVAVAAQVDEQSGDFQRNYFFYERTQLKWTTRL